MLLWVCVASVSVSVLAALGSPPPAAPFLSFLMSQGHPQHHHLFDTPRPSSPHSLLPRPPPAPLPGFRSPFVVAPQSYRPSLSQTQGSYPMRPQKLKRPAPTSGAAPAVSEVVWMACSPRLASVMRSQDAQLQCQAVVPLDTRFTWYKGGSLLQRQQQVTTAAAAAAAGESVREALEESTNEVEVSNSSSTRLIISTLVYLDCVDETDVGDYTLMVTTVTNNIYSRNFTVYMAGMTQRAQSCDLGAQVVSLIPRIYEYSPGVQVAPGESFTLPCRAQGYHHTLVWTLNNVTLTSATNPNYQVSADGGLTVTGTAAATASSSRSSIVYRCRVTSTINSAIMDTIYTSVSSQVRSS